jgi:hypothetical protein
VRLIWEGHVSLTSMRAIPFVLALSLVVLAATTRLMKALTGLSGRLRAQKIAALCGAFPCERILDAFYLR